MNTRRSRRIRRGTAEQLLQGAPVPVPDPLARLLASAAAPPQPGELAREETAVAAFHAARLAPVTASRRGQMVTPPLARFLTTKVAALALIICTTGGIALAATVGSGGPRGKWFGATKAVAGEGGHRPPRPGSRPDRREPGTCPAGAPSARPGRAGEARSAAAVPVGGLCLALDVRRPHDPHVRPGPGHPGPASAGSRNRRARGSRPRRGRRSGGTRRMPWQRHRTAGRNAGGRRSLAAPQPSEQALARPGVVPGPGESGFPRADRHGRRGGQRSRPLHARARPAGPARAAAAGQAPGSGARGGTSLSP